MTGSQRARRDNTHSDPRPITRADLEALDRKIDLLIELMCPKCGPAAIVRMHPELGPQPLRPVAVDETWEPGHMDMASAKVPHG